MVAADVFDITAAIDALHPCAAPYVRVLAAIGRYRPLIGAAGTIDDVPNTLGRLSTLGTPSFMMEQKAQIIQTANFVRNLDALGVRGKGVRGPHSHQVEKLRTIFSSNKPSNGGHNKTLDHRETILSMDAKQALTLLREPPSGAAEAFAAFMKNKGRPGAQDEDAPKDSPARRSRSKPSSREPSPTVPPLESLLPIHLYSNEATATAAIAQYLSRGPVTRQMTDMVRLKEKTRNLYDCRLSKLADIKALFEQWAVVAPFSGLAASFIVAATASAETALGELDEEEEEVEEGEEPNNFASAESGSSNSSMSASHLADLIATSVTSNNNRKANPILSRQRRHEKLLAHSLLDLLTPSGRRAAVTAAAAMFVGSSQESLIQRRPQIRKASTLIGLPVADFVLLFGDVLFPSLMPNGIPPAMADTVSAIVSGNSISSMNIRAATNSNFFNPAGSLNSPGEADKSSAGAKLALVVAECLVPRAALEWVTSTLDETETGIVTWHRLSQHLVERLVNAVTNMEGMSESVEKKAMAKLAPTVSRSLSAGLSRATSAAAVDFLSPGEGERAPGSDQSDPFAALANMAPPTTYLTRPVVPNYSSRATACDSQGCQSVAPGYNIVDAICYYDAVGTKSAIMHERREVHRKKFERRALRGKVKSNEEGERVTSEEDLEEDKHFPRSHLINASPLTLDKYSPYYCYIAYCDDGAVRSLNPYTLFPQHVIHYPEPELLGRMVPTRLADGRPPSDSSPIRRDKKISDRILYGNFGHSKEHSNTFPTSERSTNMPRGVADRRAGAIAMGNSNIGCGTTYHIPRAVKRDGSHNLDTIFAAIKAMNFGGVGHAIGPSPFSKGFGVNDSSCSTAMQHPRIRLNHAKGHLFVVDALNNDSHQTLIYVYDVRKQAVGRSGNMLKCFVLSDLNADGIPATTAAAVEDSRANFVSAASTNVNSNKKGGKNAAQEEPSAGDTLLTKDAAKGNDKEDPTQRFGSTYVSKSVALAETFLLRKTVLFDPLRMEKPESAVSVVAQFSIPGRSSSANTEFRSSKDKLASTRSSENLVTQRTLVPPCVPLKIEVTKLNRPPPPVAGPHRNSGRASSPARSSSKMKSKKKDEASNSSRITIKSGEANPKRDTSAKRASSVVPDASNSTLDATAILKEDHAGGLASTANSPHMPTPGRASPSVRPPKVAFLDGDGKDGTASSGRREGKPKGPKECLKFPVPQERVMQHWVTAIEPVQPAPGDPPSSRDPHFFAGFSSGLVAWYTPQLLGTTSTSPVALWRPHQDQVSQLCHHHPHWGSAGSAVAIAMAEAIVGAAEDTEVKRELEGLDLEHSGVVDTSLAGLISSSFDGSIVVTDLMKLKPRIVFLNVDENYKPSTVSRAGGASDHQKGLGQQHPRLKLLEDGSIGSTRASVTTGRGLGAENDFRPVGLRRQSSTNMLFNRSVVSGKDGPAAGNEGTAENYVSYEYCYSAAALAEGASALLSDDRMENGPIARRVLRFAVSHRLPLLASAGTSHCVSLWSGQARRRVAVLADQRSDVIALVFHDRHQQLLTLSDAGILKFYDMRTMQLVQSVSTVPGAMAKEMNYMLGKVQRHEPSQALEDAAGVAAGPPAAVAVDTRTGSALCFSSIPMVYPPATGEHTLRVVGEPVRWVGAVGQKEGGGAAEESANRHRHREKAEEQDMKPSSPLFQVVLSVSKNAITATHAASGSFLFQYNTVPRLLPPGAGACELGARRLRPTPLNSYSINHSSYSSTGTVSHASIASGRASAKRRRVAGRSYEVLDYGGSIVTGPSDKDKKPQRVRRGFDHTSRIHDTPSDTLSYPLLSTTPLCRLPPRRGGDNHNTHDSFQFGRYAQPSQEIRDNFPLSDYINTDSGEDDTDNSGDLSDEERSSRRRLRALRRSLYESAMGRMEGNPNSPLRTVPNAILCVRHDRQWRRILLLTESGSIEVLSLPQLLLAQKQYRLQQRQRLQLGNAGSNRRGAKSSSAPNAGGSPTDIDDIGLDEELSALQHRTALTRRFNVARLNLYVFDLFAPTAYHGRSEPDTNPNASMAASTVNSPALASLACSPRPQAVAILPPPPRMIVGGTTGSIVFMVAPVGSAAAAQQVRGGGVFRDGDELSVNASKSRQERQRQKRPASSGNVSLGTSGTENEDDRMDEVAAEMLRRQRMKEGIRHSHADDDNKIEEDISLRERQLRRWRRRCPPALDLSTLHVLSLGMVAEQARLRFQCGGNCFPSVPQRDSEDFDALAGPTLGGVATLHATSTMVVVGTGDGSLLGVTVTVSNPVIVFFLPRRLTIVTPGKGLDMRSLFGTDGGNGSNRTMEYPPLFKVWTQGAGGAWYRNFLYYATPYMNHTAIMDAFDPQPVTGRAEPVPQSPADSRGVSPRLSPRDSAANEEIKFNQLQRHSQRPQLLQIEQFFILPIKGSPNDDVGLRSGYLNNSRSSLSTSISRRLPRHRRNTARGCDNPSASLGAVNTNNPSTVFPTELPRLDAIMPGLHTGRQGPMSVPLSLPSHLVAACLGSGEVIIAAAAPNFAASQVVMNDSGGCTSDIAPHLISREKLYSLISYLWNNNSSRAAPASPLTCPDKGGGSNFETPIATTRLTKNNALEDSIMSISPIREGSDPNIDNNSSKRQNLSLKASFINKSSSDFTDANNSSSSSGAESDNNDFSTAKNRGKANTGQTSSDTLFSANTGETTGGLLPLALLPLAYSPSPSTVAAAEYQHAPISQLIKLTLAGDAMATSSGLSWCMSSFSSPATPRLTDDDSSVAPACPAARTGPWSEGSCNSIASAPASPPTGAIPLDEAEALHVNYNDDDDYLDGSGSQIVLACGDDRGYLTIATLLLPPLYNGSAENSGSASSFHHLGAGGRQAPPLQARRQVQGEDDASNSDYSHQWHQSLCKSMQTGVHFPHLVYSSEKPQYYYTEAYNLEYISSLGDLGSNKGPPLSAPAPQQGREDSPAMGALAARGPIRPSFRLRRVLKFNDGISSIAIRKSWVERPVHEEAPGGMAGATRLEALEIIVGLQTGGVVLLRQRVFVQDGIINDAQPDDPRPADVGLESARSKASSPEGLGLAGDARSRSGKRILSPFDFVLVWESISGQGHNIVGVGAEQKSAADGDALNEQGSKRRRRHKRNEQVDYDNISLNNNNEEGDESNEDENGGRTSNTKSASSCFHTQIKAISITGHPCFDLFFRCHDPSARLTVRMFGGWADASPSIGPNTTGARIVSLDYPSAMKSVMSITGTVCLGRTSEAGGFEDVGSTPSSFLSDPTPLSGDTREPRDAVNPLHLSTVGPLTSRDSGASSPLTVRSPLTSTARRRRFGQQPPSPKAKPDPVDQMKKALDMVMAECMWERQQATQEKLNAQAATDANADKDERTELRVSGSNGEGDREVESKAKIAFVKSLGGNSSRPPSGLTKFLSLKPRVLNSVTKPKKKPGTGHTHAPELTIDGTRSSKEGFSQEKEPAVTEEAENGNPSFYNGSDTFFMRPSSQDKAALSRPGSGNEVRLRPINTPGDNKRINLILSNVQKRLKMAPLQLAVRPIQDKKVGDIDAESRPGTAGPRAAEVDTNDYDSIADVSRLLAPPPPPESKSEGNPCDASSISGGGGGVATLKRRATRPPSAPQFAAIALRHWRPYFSKDAHGSEIPAEGSGPEPGTAVFDSPTTSGPVGTHPPELPFAAPTSSGLDLHSLVLLNYNSVAKAIDADGGGRASDGEEGNKIDAAEITLHKHYLIRQRIAEHLVKKGTSAGGPRLRPSVRQRPMGDRSLNDESPSPAIEADGTVHIGYNVVDGSGMTETDPTNIGEKSNVIFIKGVTVNSASATGQELRGVPRNKNPTARVDDSGAGTSYRQLLLHNVRVAAPLSAPLADATKREFLYGRPPERIGDEGLETYGDAL